MTPPLFVGYLACVIAIIGFGCQGVFIKSKEILDREIDALLVTGLFSFCTALIGLLLAIVMNFNSNPFWESDTWSHSIWVSLVYAPGNVLLLYSCRRLGVGLAVGLVSTAGTLTSFCLGIALGVPANLRTQIPGVALIILATALMTATKISTFEDWIDPIPSHLLAEVLNEVRREECAATDHRSAANLNRRNDLREGLLSPDVRIMTSRVSVDSDSPFLSSRLSAKTDPGPVRVDDLNIISNGDELSSTATTSILHESKSGGTLMLSKNHAARAERLLQKRFSLHSRSPSRHRATRIGGGGGNNDNGGRSTVLGAGCESRGGGGVSRAGQPVLDRVFASPRHEFDGFERCDPCFEADLAGFGLALLSGMFLGAQVRVCATFCC